LPAMVFSLAAALDIGFILTVIGVEGCQNW